MTESREISPLIIDPKFIAEEARRLGIGTSENDAQKQRHSVFNLLTASGIIQVCAAERNFDLRNTLTEFSFMESENMWIASTDLFYGEDWGPKDHVQVMDLSPVILTMARSMVQEGEISLNFIRVNSWTNSQYDLKAKFFSQDSQNMISSNKRPDLEAELFTSNGIIKIVGNKNGKSVSRVVSSSAASQEIRVSLFDDFQVTEDTFYFYLSPVSSDNLETKLIEDQAAYTRDILESVTSAMTEAYKHCAERNDCPYSNTKTGGFFDLNLPTARDFYNGCILVINLIVPPEEIKTTKNKSVLLPVRFYFFNYDGREVGSGIFMLAAVV